LSPADVAPGCLHASTGRTCPISKLPCRSECTFASILDEITLGIVGLDTSREEVFFQNKLALDIFKSTIKPRDYRALASLLLTDGGDEALPAGPRRIRYGTRFIGFTIYRISDNYYWICLADITEKERLNAVAEAASMMNNLGYIFSGIRHELGNPINSIKTTVTVLRDNFGAYSAENAIGFLDRVLTDVNRVELLLKDLKNFSMYETPELKRVNMIAFMDDLMSMIKRDFDEEKIRLKTFFRPDAEWGFLDHRALHQVMLNLLTNAFDAVKGRGSPLVTLSMMSSGGRIVIAVKDNGCGMPDDFKKHLFKPFFTTKTHGTGLGLVIVQKMMAKMDGTIEIESQESVGTSVTLNLPAPPKAEQRVAGVGETT
jgi:signal transduction histidine kinase